MEELGFTGERLVTSISEIHGTIEHLHRYALAMELAKNKKVLDIASGEGYGSNLLSKVASHVTGVDISEDSVNHAAKKYQKSNLVYKVGSTSRIPLEDKSVDLIVSFETLEHHDEHENMMEEMKRVLSPAGQLIISSPEKSIYKERDPNNPFHIKELSLTEFKELLSSYFSSVTIYDQRFVFGSLITNTKHCEGFNFFDGNFDAIKKDIEQDSFYNRPFFNLAIASDLNSESDISGASLFNGVKVLKKELSIKEGYLTELKTSYRYKIGSLFVEPINFIKKLVKG